MDFNKKILISSIMFLLVAFTNTNIDQALINKSSETIQNSSQTTSFSDTLKINNPSKSFVMPISVLENMGYILDFEFSQDGSKILISSKKGIGLYQSKDLSLVWFKENDENHFSETIFFLSDGENYASASFGKMTITNLYNGKELVTIDMKSNIVTALQFSDGENLYIEAGESVIFNLKEKTFTKIDKAPNELNYYFYHIDNLNNNEIVYANNEQVISRNSTGDVACFFDYNELASFDKMDVVDRISSTNNANTVFVERRNTVDILDICKKEIIKSMPIDNGNCTSNVSKNKQSPLITIGCGKSLMLMDFDNFGVVNKEFGLPVKDEITHIEISPDNSRILTADYRNGNLFLLDKDGNIIAEKKFGTVFE